MHSSLRQWSAQTSLGLVLVGIVTTFWSWQFYTYLLLMESGNTKWVGTASAVTGILQLEGHGSVVQPLRSMERNKVGAVAPGVSVTTVLNSGSPLEKQVGWVGWLSDYEQSLQSCGL